MFKKLIGKLTLPDRCLTHPDGTTWVTAEVEEWYNEDYFSTYILQEIRQNRFGMWVRAEHWKKFKNITDYYKEFNI